MVQKTLLNDTPENLINRYGAVLKQSGIVAEKLIMFGSYAKGKSRPDSDLDVCVVSKAFGKNRLQESMDLAALTVKVDSMIEPYPCHPDDLNNKYDPLIHEINTHGIQFAID